MACIRSYLQKYSGQPKLFTGNFQRWEEIQCLKSRNMKYDNANRRRETNGQNN